MESSDELFLSAIGWLKENYCGFRFFVERDVVWTVQKRILELVEQKGIPYRVFNDYPILPGKGRRSRSVDLAIVSQDETIEVAAEFKYEPSRRRHDICRHKLPVVFWTGEYGVGKDIERIQDFISAGKAQIAYSIFIDEGGRYRKRTPYPQSRWIDWGSNETETYKVSVLWSQDQAR
jgi:hypothetical protein